jgi:tRNA(Ile)-lysidine synthase
MGGITAPVIRPILEQVESALARTHCVLAVSGGVDSMVLLDAAATVTKRRTLTVATFDHGTGPAATAAVHLVARRAESLGIPTVIGRIPSRAGKRVDKRGRAAKSPTEADWRQHRWRFLHNVAHQVRGTVVTAHTRDDQIETVFMRILREAGPRGVAALYADSAILRPLLDVPRHTILAYAEERQINFVTDPSNTDRRHLRNRVRHDLIPAITAIHPTFPADLLDLARRSVAWRAQMDHIAATFTVMPDAQGVSYLIPRHQLAGFPVHSLRVLWPALAARMGVIMDWRGTHRLASFTIEGETGQSIQLSGGVDVLMRRDAMVVHRKAPTGSRGE